MKTILILLVNTILYVIVRAFCDYYTLSFHLSFMIAWMFGSISGIIINAIRNKK